MGFTVFVFRALLSVGVSASLQLKDQVNEKKKRIII